MKQRIIGIFLLFCIVLPVLAVFSFIQYQKEQIKKEVKRQIINGIDKEDLVSLRFLKNEIEAKVQWLHSKEFQYKGQLYDIVETEYRGDTIYYLCWWDHKETELNKLLEQTVNHTTGNDPLTKQNKKRLANFYKSLFYEEILVWKIYNTQIESAATFHKFVYQTFSIPPPYPPPKANVKQNFN